MATQPTTGSLPADEEQREAGYEVSAKHLSSSSTFFRSPKKSTPRREFAAAIGQNEVLKHNGLEANLKQIGEYGRSKLGVTPAVQVEYAAPGNPEQDKQYQQFLADLAIAGIRVINPALSHEANVNGESDVPRYGNF